jgi:outer membrane protein assembly factor BamB
MIRAFRPLASVAVVLGVSAGLSGCAGFKGPQFLNFGAKKENPRIAPGQRIPVLPSSEDLKPAAALKGVDFEIPAPEAVTDWPLPGGNPAQALGHVAGGANFQVAWRKHIGPGDTRTTHAMAPPVVAEGLLFVMDGRAGVTALDAATGRDVWRVDLSNRRGPDRDAFGGGVAYSDGLLFVTSGYRFIAALEAKTGKTVWRVSTSSPVHGAPSVAAGKVYAIDVLDQLQSYDAKTGAPGWTYQPLEEPARMLIASSVASEGEEVIAPFASGELVAVSAANGTDLWTDVLTLTTRNNALSEIRDIAGRPAIYRGAVYSGSHSGVVGATELRTGRRLWQLPLATITSLWPAGDVVYITSQGGDIYCVARETGQIYWIKELNRPLRKKFRSEYSGPMLASNRLVVVNDKGLLLGFDPKTGAQTAKLQLGAPGFITPIAAGGLLYVLTNTGEIVAVR